MIKKDKTKTRIQFDFSNESLQRLDKLVTETGATTRAELIRNALSLYAEVVEAQDRGAKLMLKEKDGTVVQLILHFNKREVK